MEKNQIFTTQELAKYLKLNEKTVIKMAQNGHLPGVKIGNQWRFHLKAIDNFLLRDMTAASDEELDSVIKTDVDIFPLSRLIDQKMVDISSELLSPSNVFTILAKMAVENKLISSQEALIRELKSREKILSTGIGRGVAIPHPRHPSPELFTDTRLIIFLAKKGIEWNAPDKKPVYTFFMPCALNEHTHIRLLAKISKFFHLKGNIDKLIRAETKEEIMQVLLEFDRELMYPADAAVKIR